MIQHAFLFQISHVTFEQNQYVCAVFFKRFLSAKMFLFACNILSMFWKDSVKFMMLNASKSFACPPNSMQRSFTLSSPFEAFQLALYEMLFPLTPPFNYLNFNLNGLAITHAQQRVYHRKNVGLSDWAGIALWCMMFASPYGSVTVCNM